MIPSDLPGKLGSYLVVSEAKSPPDDSVPDPRVLREVKSEAPRSLATVFGGNTAITAMFSSMKKEHRIVLGASFQVSSGSVGITSQLVSNDILSGLTEFTALSTIFSEFFINKFEVVYQPQSRYSKPYGPIDLPNDVPLVVANLQHGMPAYTSHTEACSNAGLFITNTADPWKVRWNNTERKSSGVVPVAGTTTATPSQGWCLTDVTNAGLYTGALQIISPAALPNPAFNFLYGTVVVRWDVSFRSRA